MALVLPEEWVKEQEVVDALHDSVDMHSVLLVEVQQAEGHVEQEDEHDKTHSGAPPMDTPSA